MTTRTQAYAEARRDRAESLPVHKIDYEGNAVCGIDRRIAVRSGAAFWSSVTCPDCLRVYPPPAGASPRAPMREPRPADVLADELDEAANLREGAIVMLLQEAADALRGASPLPLEAAPLPLPPLNGIAAAIETIPEREPLNRAHAKAAIRAATECLRGATGGAIERRPEAQAARTAIDAALAALACANAAGQAVVAAQADDRDSLVHAAILDANSGYACLAAGHGAQRAAAAIRAVCEGKPPIQSAPHLRRAAAALDAGNAAIAAASANAPPRPEESA